MKWSTKAACHHDRDAPFQLFVWQQFVLTRRNFVPPRCVIHQTLAEKQIGFFNHMPAPSPLGPVRERRGDRLAAPAAGGETCDRKAFL
jgi:hypothetical protein